MSEVKKTDWEAEMASLVDVINQELRVNGPIEVEQYPMCGGREGVRKLVDYLRDKIERREARAEAAEAKVAALTKERDRLIETWNDDHKGVLEHNAALTERVKELERGQPKGFNEGYDAATRQFSPLAASREKALADRVAQMEGVVEECRRYFSNHGPQEMAAHLARVLSRLTAPEKKPCVLCGGQIAPSQCGVTSHCPPSPGKGA